MKTNENHLKFKPLLFTTTMRNPERLKLDLWVLKRFDGKILTDDLASKIVGELIKFGLYRPMKIDDKIHSKWKSTNKGEFSDFLLSDSEVKKIMDGNPQKHKEAGFKCGYPSRFATIFDFAKEMGFVYFKIDEKIEFSELGKILADIVNVEISGDEITFSLNSPEREQEVFLQSLARSQRNNPFVKVANDNIPLVLLLQTIRLINLAGGKGVSRREIPLLLFWKDNDATSLCVRILKLRRDFGFTPSDEAVIDICINEIMGGDYKKFNPQSIMTDYVDEFIRKMRMTGLISLRGAGRFVDINHNEDKKVDYILDNYADYEHFSDEREYFLYISKIDENLVLRKTEKSTQNSDKFLQKWLSIYDWQKIKAELRILSSKKTSKDEVLRFLSSSVRLEFLTALAIKSKCPKVKVKPNYCADDEGLPISTAGGNKGDIECFEDRFGILVEVTMAEGRTQTMMEIWPIERHFADFIAANKMQSQCVFVAPTIFSDSKRQIEFVKFSKDLTIRDFTIEQFSDYLESEKTLYATLQKN